MNGPQPVLPLEERIGAKLIEWRHWLRNNPEKVFIAVGFLCGLSVVPIAVGLSPLLYTYASMVGTLMGAACATFFAGMITINQLNERAYPGWAQRLTACVTGLVACAATAVTLVQLPFFAVAIVCAYAAGLVGGATEMVVRKRRAPQVVNAEPRVGGPEVRDPGRSPQPAPGRRVGFLPQQRGNRHHLLPAPNGQVDPAGQPVEEEYLRLRVGP